MACVLQAVSAVKLVDATLLACDNKGPQKKSGSLLNDQLGGVLQASSALTRHKSIDLI